MSLPDGAEYWWPSWANSKERKPKSEHKKEREKKNIEIRRAYKKAHPEISSKQIQKLAAKLGGYDELQKQIKQ